MKGKSGSGKIARPIVNIAVGGISLGMAVMIVTVAIVTGFQNEIKNKIIGFGSHINILKYDNNVSNEPLPIPQNQGFLNEIKKMPQVNHIQVFANKNGIIKTKTENEGVVLKGVDKDYDWTFFKNNLVEGSVPKLNDALASDAVLISKSLAKRLNFKINDKLLVYFINKKINDSTESVTYEQRVRDFKICGIYETGFEELDAKTILVDIKHIRKLNYWAGDEIGGFEIQLKNLKNLDVINEQVNETIGYEYVSQSVKQSNEGLFSWLDLMDSNAIIIITLIICVAAINMISALLILILEKTNMIGLLKALGCSNAAIRSVFLNVAVRLIIKGLLFGNLIGIGFCILQSNFHWFKLNKETYYIDFVPINLGWVYILLLNLGTILICLVMMLLPTLVISKITPIKALRFR